MATGTKINDGGHEIISDGGTSVGTTINYGGGEHVSSGGTSTGTTIHLGGVEVVSGIAIGTIISGGTENVEGGGRADNVMFAGSHSTLELARPAGLAGTISDWHVGDVIDFLNTTVTGVHETGNTLTVSYGGQTASYLLAGQEANTEFKLQSDGHGGTELILAPIVGVSSLHTDHGHLFV